MSHFWMDDISVLINSKYILQILPNSSYDTNQNLNAIFRFSILYSMISFILFKKNTVFVFPLLTMILTIYIYTYSGTGITKDSKIKVIEKKKRNSHFI